MQVFQPIAIRQATAGWTISNALKDWETDVKLLDKALGFGSRTACEIDPTAISLETKNDDTTSLNMSKDRIWHSISLD
ncbi:MAG: hypothetical protein U1E58_08445 [Tabrizicola sp.]